MKEKIKSAIKSGDIFKIRSAYKKEGRPVIKTYSSLSGLDFRKKVSIVKMANRKLTLNESIQVLSEAKSLIKNTPIKKKAGVMDVLKIVLDLVSPYTWLFIGDSRLNTAFKMLKEYVSENSRTASISKKAISTLWPPTDMSMVTLEMLLNEGYTTVEWETNPLSLDEPCMSMDGQTWELQDFINQTSYSAPIFSKTHVGCKCKLRVTGPGQTDQIVVAY